MKKEDNFTLATIGPQTESISSLKSILTFSNVIRLNGSHNSVKWHKNIILKVKKINPDCTILFDIPGVKPRTLNEKEIIIKNNQTIKFIDKTHNGSKKDTIALSNPIPKINSSTKYFTISDGQYNFEIKKYGKGFIIGKSLSNFILYPKKGLNIESSIYSDKLQFAVYKSFISKTQNIGYDAVGVSFIQNSNMLDALKKLFPKLIIVAKIENSEGLKNLKSICLSSDAVMIDRGDLSAEIGDINLYSSVNKIANEIKKIGKPLIMATENLESMQVRSTPTKSEIMSLGHSLSLGADKIMLSEETAVSSNWLQTLKWLNRFFTTVSILPQNHRDTTDNRLDTEISDIIWKTIKNTNDTPIIVFSRSGAAIQKAKSINPSARIISFTDKIRTLKLSKLWSNVSCFYLKKFDNSKGNNFVFSTIKKYKNEIFKSNKNAIVLYISNPKPGSRANTITVIKKNDF